MGSEEVLSIILNHLDVTRRLESVLAPGLSVDSTAPCMGWPNGKRRSAHLPVLLLLS